MDGRAQEALATALHMSGAEITGPAEISLLLTDDAAQQALNNQWRQKNSPTNVLSFPALEPFVPVSGFIGDISLARETLEREATEMEKSFSDHFSHLLVHGMLHCLGYDHENDADALVMETLETEILHHLGIADPYDNQ